MMELLIIIEISGAIVAKLKKSNTTEIIRIIRYIRILYFFSKLFLNKILML